MSRIHRLRSRPQKNGVRSDSGDPVGKTGTRINGFSEYKMSLENHKNPIAQRKKGSFNPKKTHPFLVFLASSWDRVFAKTRILFGSLFGSRILSVLEEGGGCAVNCCGCRWTRELFCLNAESASERESGEQEGVRFDIRVATCISERCKTTISPEMTSLSPERDGKEEEEKGGGTGGARRVMKKEAVVEKKADKKKEESASSSDESGTEDSVGDEVET